MKDKSRSLPGALRPLLAFAALAVSTVGPAALADEAPPAPAASSGAPTTINFDFPGGPLSQLLAMLPKSWPINIVGPKADLAAPLPPFSVQNVRRDELLSLISGLLEPNGFHLTQLSDHLGILSKRGEETHPAFISREISPLLDSQRTIDDVVDAIRTACAMLPSEDANALQIKFHPRTGLLLIAGPENEVEVALKVIDGLNFKLRSPEEKFRPGSKFDPREK